MRNDVILSLTFGLFIATAGVNLASAVEAQRPGPTATTPTRAKAVPLSTGDCKKLGGTVALWETACASSIKCTFVDQHGKTHEVCINER
jgi:hypothetical protein